ncbi:AraC family transcriptional regulator [Clostridium tagluense]|uniref:AraC family transcriptional regulator n=1 Tax=Clostridium tagluense TaxID=360422 RepID=UPI001C0C7E75|nr:AraC family transcriptional regulator [Clostridium tagluense]MBU3128261.1 AraC family transcriptional regulator [Clostridium tagluense]MCB2310753.1 AraC family transcriptional regulator [Clostridium tagluense]MCB2315517.1 AraC family transcriptional regulator [Clostridium tagluense]MCB2320371.1 AraC family transcriptional regulator [Clostridium tagluense]MCB2325346.1 AraC family transcriptional regulator [Clostridium tagluense]
MELFTIDESREIKLPVYIETKEPFSSENYSMFRLILVEKGGGIVSLNKNTIIFTAPTIFCFNANDRINLDKCTNLSARAIYFSPTLVNNVLTLEKMNNLEADISESEYRDYCSLLPFVYREELSFGQFEVGPATANRIAKLFDSLEAELTLLNNNFWRCRSRSFFLEILFLIQYIYTDMENATKLEVVKCSDEINEIILYLHTHYERKIFIEELTEEFHINRTTLTDRFARSTGMSVIGYLIRLRVKMAAIMLRDTMLSVSEIAYRVGFNDITHFGRMFRKHMGYSASEYRKKKME